MQLRTEARGMSASAAADKCINCSGQLRGDKVNVVSVAGKM